MLAFHQCVPSRLHFPVPALNRKPRLAGHIPLRGLLCTGHHPGRLRRSEGTDHHAHSPPKNIRSTAANSQAASAVYLYPRQDPPHVIRNFFHEKHVYSAVWESTHYLLVSSVILKYKCITCH